MLKRSVQSLFMYAIFYTAFCCFEMMGIGEAKKIFFFTYVGITVVFTSLVVFPLINRKLIEKSQDDYYGSLVNILYTVLLIATTALPVLISWILSLLFSGIDFFTAFAVVETLVYAASSLFYILFCSDAEASEKVYVASISGNCLSFANEKRKRNLL